MNRETILPKIHSLTKHNMTCTELVTANRILLDMVNGKRSLIGFWETMLLVPLVPVPLAFMVAPTYTREASEEQPDLSIRVYLNEQPLKEQAIRLHFPSGDLPARSILHIQHLELPSTGTVQIRAWNQTQNKELICRTYAVNISGQQ